MGFKLALLLLQVAVLQLVSAGTIGRVDCRVSMHWSEEFIEAHEKCMEKLTKEHAHDEKEPYQAYPRNATLEDYDFDDKCHTNCVFRTMGMLSGDDVMLPDKKDTSKFLTRGKISDERYAKMTAMFDTCLDKVDKLSKDKKMDKCKTASLLEFCFFKELRSSEESMAIDC